MVLHGPARKPITSPEIYVFTFVFSFALYFKSKQLGNVMLSFYNRQYSMSILYRRTSVFSKGRGQRTKKFGGGILHVSKTGRRRYSFFNVMLVLVISRASDFVLYYSICVPGWVLKCLNLITAPGSVSNQPGSVTWLATAGISKIHAVSWRNHIENQTTKGAQNM